MHQEGWDLILKTPVPVLISTPGHNRAHPVWVDREEETLILCDSSQGALVRCLQQEPATYLTVQSDGQLGQFRATVELIFDPEVARVRAHKIWRRYQGARPPVFSPQRCDTLIRLKEISLILLSWPSPLEQTFLVYADDSSDLMRAKILQRLNDFLAYHKVPPIKESDPPDFVESQNVRSLPRVNKRDIVPFKSSDSLLKQIFCSSPPPAWVNLRALVLEGRTRLIKLDWQQPAVRSPEVSCSQIIAGYHALPRLEIVD